MRTNCSAATRKHTMGGQNYFKGGGKNYAKYNKLNNNSQKFRGARLLPGGASPPLAPL